MITGKSAARSFQRNVGDWPKTMCRQKLRNAVPEAGKPALSCSRSMGLTFPLRSSLSVLRNRASRINGPAISPHVDCSLLRGSTALTALDPHSKSCARPAMRTIIGRFHFSFTPECGLGSDIGPVRTGLAISNTNLPIPGPAQPSPVACRNLHLSGDQ